MRVFVNAVPVDVDPGTDVVGALRAYDPELESRVAAGTAYVTDARGITVAGDSPLSAGAILRVVVGARRRAEGGDADA
jgi:hypothetical protein